jgi:hypothetical protein
LVEHFAADNVVLAIDQTDDATNAALLLEPRQLGIWHTFLPSQAQIAPALVASNESLRRLFRDLRGPSLAIEMLCQDPDFSTCFAEDVAKSTQRVEHVETVAIEVDGAFDEYWGRRPRNLRKATSRRLNSLGNALRFEKHTSRQDVERALERYGELEIAGWKGRSGTALHKSNPQGRFYADVLSGFAESDEARIYELYLDDRLASSQITICSERMLVMLKTTYDESLAKSGPGRLLQYKLLEDIFAESRKYQVEYYTNATAEQIAWSTEKRTIEHVMLFREQWIRRAWQLYRDLRASTNLRSCTCRFPRLAY